MNSEIALNIIGQVLMAGRDNTPLGVSEEKDFRAYHKSLQYFHLVWLREEIDRIIKCNDKENEFSFNDYVLALRTLSKQNPQVYEIIPSEPFYCEMVIHIIPEMHIVVNDKKKSPHLLIWNGHEIDVHNTDAGLYPKELVRLFTDIDTKLKERTKDIIISGLKDIVPESLKEYFLRGKFTKDMGSSMHSDSRFSMAHEIRLKASDTHDMTYAYIPDYFWQDRERVRMLKNVEYSYWALLEIAARLPKDVEFVCQHRDDCGVSFTDEHPAIDNDEYFRRKAVLMVREDKEYYHEFGEKDYRDIMDYCGLSDKMSLQEFINMCVSDNIKLENHKHEINSLIGAYAEEVTIVFNTDNISIFLMPNRNQEWTRECFLMFPYHTNLSFLKDIGIFLDKSKELVSVFNNSLDIDTSVGLLKTNKHDNNENKN